MTASRSPRASRAVKAGSLIIGGGFPVSVQTMWKRALRMSDLEAATAELSLLAPLGCDLVRFAVPDLAAAEAVGELSRRVSMPIAADIHFDHTLALRCLDFPIAKIRIPSVHHRRTGLGGAGHGNQRSGHRGTDGAVLS